MCCVYLYIGYFSKKVGDSIDDGISCRTIWKDVMVGEVKLINIFLYSITTNHTSLYTMTYTHMHIHYFLSSSLKGLTLFSLGVVVDPPPNIFITSVSILDAAFLACDTSS